MTRMPLLARVVSLSTLFPRARCAKAWRATHAALAVLELFPRQVDLERQAKVAELLLPLQSMFVTA